MSLEKRRCIECGYLCFELIERRFLGNSGTSYFRMSEYENLKSYQEITTKERSEDLELRRGSKNLFCYRREVSFEVELEAILKAHESSESKECSELDNLIKNARKCRYYTRYISGYNPIQHLTRWEAIDRERSNRIWNLIFLVIGAFLGAFLTVAVNWWITRK